MELGGTITHELVDMIGIVRHLAVVNDTTEGSVNDIQEYATSATQRAEVTGTKTLPDLNAKTLAVITLVCTRLITSPHGAWDV